jgi:hypothetical protein
MADRILNPQILNAKGALIDFAAIAVPMGRKKELEAIKSQLKTSRALFLRWTVNPLAGLPSEPFKVWRRPATPLAEEKAVQAEVVQLPPLYALLQFPEPMASISLFLRAPAPATIFAMTIDGAPTLDRVTDVKSKALPANGVWKVEFFGARITGLVISGSATFDTLRGITQAAATDVKNWELVETVGLPVDEAEWAALAGQDHGVKQGLVGAQLPAAEAAADRFRRGVNPLGWWPTFPNGHVAPDWDMPDPLDLVKEAGIELLPMLRQVAGLPPDQQVTKLFTFTIKPPQNAGGQTMPGQPGKAKLTPIGLLQMIVASDPLLAVTLGFGTGYADEDIPAIVLGDRAFFNDPSRSDWDWMITGLWRKGLDGKSAAAEYACIVPRPPLALPAPAPADLRSEFQGHLRPAAPNQPWTCNVRTSWERFPLPNFGPVASFAYARRSIVAAGPAIALLEDRGAAKGLKPIANTTNAKDSEPTRQSATDATLAIPNDPGSVAQRYGVATQTVFGLWSPWVTDTLSVAQPDPPPVQILSADLAPSDPGSGSLCPARLICEISVDWRVRTPGEIDFRGRLYSAAQRGDPPPPGAAISGVQRSLGAAETATKITFAGSVPAMSGGKVEAMNPEGTAIVAPGPAGQGSGARRYRVTIPNPDQPIHPVANPGFALNFAAKPHVGLLLEARGIDSIAPKHIGPWPERPAVAVASDPRSRPTTVLDLVQLASLPDAAGRCHAKVSWAHQAAAAGYALYETTETKMRASRNLPDPAPSLTLSARLTQLKTAFAANPLRTDFVRRNAELLTGESTDVALPRGSQVIHLFVVIPVSAGGIEGPWPAGPDADKALIPWAAPRLAEPAPPLLEVTALQSGGDWSARLRVGTRPTAGARPKRIDLYRVRVDDAARALDSMGPPIATLSASGGGWTVAEGNDNGQSWIESVTGDDHPGGSWRRVWYRAVAWGDDDFVRGVRRGRSRPSPAAPVVIPPSDVPDLSALAVSWPGGGIGDVLVSFTSTAPVPDTVLGPHRIAIEAGVPKGTSLVSLTSSLSALGNAAPVSGSGAWRSGNHQYRLLLRRASVNDPLSVTVRIIDPLNRSTTRTLRLAAGSVLPLPDLTPIDVVVIPNIGKRYSFSTDAPLAPALPYRLQLELTPVSAGLVAAGLKPPFSFNGSAYVVDQPIGSIPDVAGTGPLTIRRQTLHGRSSFALTAKIALKVLVARIVTPDGRSVQTKRRG